MGQQSNCHPNSRLRWHKRAARRFGPSTSNLVMSKRRNSVVAGCALGVLLVCLGLLAASYGAYRLQNRVTATFGPPASHLELSQRLRLSAQLLMQSEDLTRPVYPLGEQRPFQVAWGESLPAIASRLQAEGLIHNADVFQAYLQYAGLDTTLQAGNYVISPAMTPLEIAHALQDATPSEVTLTILAGWRMDEIAETLPTSGLEISPAEFLAGADDIPADYAFLEEAPEGASLEGFLFPGSYVLPRESTLGELISALLDNFGEQLTPDLQKGFAQQDLDVYEAVTLASIVEKESIVPDEMPLIASVFINRLSAGIKLEADSTVQYAIGFNQVQKTWWTNPLSQFDLQIQSPYNTYQFPGLPPGPIANPGLSALRAVAFPAQTPYYYFRAACDGSGKHVFSKTFEEHVQNACPDN
ncbi:MAG: endolytic transglycosylase MltG [Anaerolineales bacterium]|jgi:UPF0755 protein